SATDRDPVDRWSIELRPRTSVDRQPGGSTLGGRTGEILDPGGRVPAQADLDRDRDVGRDGLAHRTHDVTDTLRRLEDRCATIVVVHRLGGTAEVEIDAWRAEVGGEGCRL